MRRVHIVAFAIFAAVLMVSAPPAAAATANAIASQHTTDTDFANATAPNWEIEGSGESASISLEERIEYNVVDDSGDGSTDGDIGLVADTISDSVRDSEWKTVPTSSMTVDRLTVNIVNTFGGEVVNVDIYAIQEEPDATRVEGVKIKDDWDPGTGTGVKTINLDSSFDVDAGETWTIAFTMNDDNDGVADGIEIGVDESLTGWTDADTSGDGGGDLSLIRTDKTSGSYVSANHSAENVTQAAVDVTLNNADATLSVEEYSGGSWSTVASTTVSASGNHTLDISTATATPLRTKVDVSSTGANTDATIHDESILFDPVAPAASLSSPADGTTLDDSTVTLEADINDPDFALAQGDTVTAEFFVDGTSVGTDTLSSNGTASVQHEETIGGSHDWYVVATDSGGETVQTANRSFTVPGTLTVRRETPPHDTVTTATVTVKFYEDTDQNQVIVERTTTTGVIDLSGLPTGSEFSVSIEADGYYNRTATINDLFSQSSVFLLNKSVPSVQNRFTVNDRTGNFPPDETELIVQKAINRSEYGGSPSGYSWTNVAGDDLGADESFTGTLAQDDRYRLVVQNSDGDTRVLGAYTASTTGTIELRIGNVVVDPEGGDAIGYEATRTNETGQSVKVRFEYNDTASNTSTLWVSIHEYNNESNVLLSNTSYSGPYGAFALTELVPAAQNDTTWVVDVYGERSGGDFEAELVVGPKRDVLQDMPQWLVTVFFVGIIFMVAGLFSQLNGAVGGLVVAGLGGMFWFVGFAPPGLGAGVVALSMITAGVLFVREKGGGL